jgi:hypothetical protein
MALAPTGWSVLHWDRHAGSPLQPPRQSSYAAHEGSAVQVVDSLQQLVFAHDAQVFEPYESPQVIVVSAWGGLSSTPAIWRHAKMAPAPVMAATSPSAPIRLRTRPRRYHVRRGNRAKTACAIFTIMSDAPREKSWDERILERITSGVDETLIEQNLKLTPTERLEKMSRVLEFIDDVRRANRDKLPSPR